MNAKGLLTQVMQWFTHPSFSDGDTMDWGAGLLLILCIAFLWSTVVNQIAEVA